MKSGALREAPPISPPSEVSRVGLAIASGEMSYDELLEWIIDNEV